MKRWNVIDGKEVITTEYVQYLFNLGQQCATRDDVDVVLRKQDECHSVGCAVLGGFKLAQGRWNTPFTAEEKTWRRYGNVKYDELSRDFVPSFNHAEQRLEGGVSVIDADWEHTVSAQFFGGDIYEFRGIQVSWGSDGEPLVIPTSVPKKVNK